MTSHSTATLDPVVSDAAAKLQAEIATIASTSNNMTSEQVVATLEQVTLDVKVMIEAEKTTQKAMKETKDKESASSKPASSGGAGAQPR